jgi:glucose-6-phosphate 1-epimerase
MTDSSVTMELAPSDYTKEMWDKDFLCTFTVDLEADQLSTKMLVENKGGESFDFQAALHSYFTVSSIDNLEISGSFEGKEFLNKMIGDGEMQTEDRSVITISEEYDRVYKGVNDPVLSDKGTGKTVSIRKFLLLTDLTGKSTAHYACDSNSFLFNPFFLLLCFSFLF